MTSEILLRDISVITQKFIGCAFEASNSLGIGFLEKVYENVLVHLIRKAGLKVIQQHPIRVTFGGILFGEFVADLLIEDRVLVVL